MKLEDLQRFLDNHGILYRESGVSLVLETCPACGSRDYKVRLRVHGIGANEPYLGRCQRGSCETGFSSTKYLISMGVPVGDVMALHGHDPEKNFESIIPATRDFSEALIEHAEEEIEKDLDISGFFKICDWEDHPAAAYAKRRGVTPAQYDFIRIDPTTNAVVFICFDRDDEGAVQGFQKRFVSPSRPQDKARSSMGFQRSKHLLTFPHEGDILVCEGPFTALSAWHYGYYGVCTFGSHISPEQLEQIVEIAAKSDRNVGIAFESDKAGKIGFDKLRKTMYWLDREVFKAISGVPGDLNDAWQENAKIWREYDPEWGGPAIPDIEGML